MSNSEASLVVLVLLVFGVLFFGGLGFMFGHLAVTDTCTVTSAVTINHGQYIVENGVQLVCIDGQLSPIKKAVLP